MAGNSFGQLFKVTTFGESHGSAIGVIIDGVPPNIPLKEKDIQADLDRRKPGQSSVTTQRKESDTVEILSGVFEEHTIGTPLAMLIRNKDHRSTDYSNIKDILRPGHADDTYLKKFGIRDYRGGGRASGRETAARVAAGAVAKKILDGKRIRIAAYTLAVADIYADKFDASVIEHNAVRAPDMQAAKLMIQKISEAKVDGDSVGGIVEAIVKRCPAGLGDPVFDKLDARIAQALMSIGGTRGVEFGKGFEAAKMKGSEHNDRYYVSSDKVQTHTNNSGGIIGGISNGNDIVVRVAVKPTSSIAKPQETVTVDNKKVTLEIKGRHDPCLCPRIVPVVEAMLAITIADCLLIQKSIK
jgi:chorismate synthase